MLVAAVGKGRNRHEWAFGLRWVREHAADSALPKRKFAWKKPSQKDAAILAAKQRASIEGDPGFACTLGGDDVLIGWPDKGSHLKGNEYSAALGIASLVGTGLVLNYFAGEGKLWGLLVHDGNPMANGEYLLPVSGDEQTILSILLEHWREAEQYVGLKLPIYASDNLLPLLHVYNYEADYFDVAERLAGIRKLNPYQLQRVKKASVGAKPNLMIGVVIIAGILAFFRDDIWALFESEQPVSIEAMSPVGPTPEEKYLTDMNLALSSALTSGPETVGAIYEVVRLTRFREPGWKLSQVDCENTGCRFDWIREKGGEPVDLPGATMTSLNGASTNKSYKTVAGELGVPIPLSTIGTLSQVADSARQSKMNALIYPPLLQLLDLGYSVTLGPATALIAPVKGVVSKESVVVRPLAMGGGISGTELPLIIEAWKKLPLNINLKKFSLRLGRLSSEDRLDIQGSLVTVEGVK